MNSVFKVAFLIHAPDVEPEKHRAVIETSKYKLITVTVRNQVQAVDLCSKSVEEEAIHIDRAMHSWRIRR